MEEKYGTFDGWIWGLILWFIIWQVADVYEKLCTVTKVKYNTVYEMKKNALSKWKINALRRT